MNEKILVVEDEESLREALAYNLNKQGYAVTTAADGKTALSIALSENPDLILLDVMLPGLDGIEVCRQLRQTMATPIIMLTARDEVIDRVVGLEVGADDYLTKPFSMHELHARIKAMLRRVQIIRTQYQPAPDSGEEEKLITFTNVVINLSRHEVSVNGNAVDLKPKEYDLLVYLASHPDQVISREKILQEVWGWDYFGDSRTVDVHMRWLREKIEIDPHEPVHLITVRGTGYRLKPKG